MSIYQKENDLDRLIVQLKGILIKYESQDLASQNEKYSESILVFERIKCAESAYSGEIDRLQKVSKDTHLARLKEKQTLIAELKGKMDNLKSIISANAGTMKITSDEKLPYDNKLIVWGNELQNKTQDSINRIRNLTIESEKIGNDVSTNLEEQKENLNRVRLTIHGVDENLSTARQNVKKLATSILRDKCTIILVATIVMLLVSIGMVLYFFRKK